MYTHRRRYQHAAKPQMTEASLRPARASHSKFSLYLFPHTRYYLARVLHIPLHLCPIEASLRPDAGRKPYVHARALSKFLLILLRFYEDTFIVVLARALSIYFSSYY